MNPMVIFLLGASAPRTEEGMNCGNTMPPIAAVRRKSRLDSISIRPLNFLRSRRVIDKLQRLIHQDLARPLAQARARDIVVALETKVVLFRQDVPEGVVREAEQKIGLPMHFALEIKADVRQGLAGDGQDLGIPQIDQVKLCRYAFGIAAWAAGQLLE